MTDHAPPFDPKAIAVALGYEEGDVPKVLAKGQGWWAEQILQLAFANDVKVRKDEDLAQNLKAMDLDAPIPPEAFAAVAEILAYVYEANALYQQRKEDDTQEHGEPQHDDE